MNALDFGIFQESLINKVSLVVNSTPSQEEQPRVRFAELDAFITTSKVDATPCSSKKAHHANVICDSCENEIYGYRYKCMECVDFDLCMDCEAKMGHNQHAMIRIADPSDAEFYYRSRLGKRFFRQRRAESAKCDEKSGDSKKHHHHKRQTCGQKPVPFDAFISFLEPLLQSNQNAQQTAAQKKPTSTATTTTNNNNSNNGTNPNVTNWNWQRPTTAANTTQTPPATPINPIPACVQNLQHLISMGLANANAKLATSQCPVQSNVKTGIDAISSIAQNFATMMDPFAMQADSNGNAAETTTTTTSSTTTQTSTAQATGTTSLTDSASGTNATKPNTMTLQYTKITKEKSPEPEPIIVDLSDDDEILQHFLARSQERNQAASEQPSTENEKASPSRDWTLVNAEDIEDMNQGAAAKITGAIPKTASTVTAAASNVEQTPPKEQEKAATQMEFEQLSRLLSAHLKEAEKQNETPRLVPTTKTPEVPSAPAQPIHPGNILFKDVILGFN